MLVDVRVILLVEDNTMVKYLHPYTESLGSTHAWTCQRRDGLSHYQNLTGLSALGSILKKNFLGNRCQWMRESYSWLKTTQWVNIYIPI
jgi:hypothetical protein